MKKILTGVVTCSLLLGSGVVGLHAQDNEKKDQKVGVSLIDDGDDTIGDEIRDGIEDVNERHNHQLIFESANNDINDQKNDIKKLIDERVDVLIIDPIKIEDLNDVLAQAKNAKIPVVMLHKDDKKVKDVTSWVSFDAKKDATKLADYVMKDLDDSNKVMLLKNNDDQSFINEFRKAASGLKIVKEVSDEDLVNELSQHSDINAIIIPESSLDNVTNALTDTNLENVKVYTYGVNQMVKADLDDDMVTAGIENDQEKLGKMSMRIANKIMKGEKVKVKYHVAGKIEISDDNDDNEDD